MSGKKGKGGRPMLNETPRVRTTTTIEPAYREILRRYAEDRHISMGQLVDQLVKTYFAEPKAGKKGS